jgi:HlyD family secretion protein/adhesin transport system membrane fusion protein
MIIYSPIEGTVDKVHFNYKSAVISPGESIADISPIRGQLIAEAKIPRKNIGFVEVGQKAAIKIDTYAFTKYGAINGTIASISRESYEEKEEEYYFAKISLEKNFLERGGVRHYISQSMEFPASITTGSRRIIEYAIKPITDAIEESFDER